jgi:hypothetical protein
VFSFREKICVVIGVELFVLASEGNFAEKHESSVVFAACEAIVG